MSNASVHTGRHFLQIPGPTNVPDRVLRAMDMPTIDHRGPEFAQLGFEVIEGSKKIFKTKNPVIIYPSSGTGAWEAAIVNTLSPGDKVLMVETGQFATLWRALAERMKLEVEFVPAGHVLGSAQIVLRHRGETIVVSGDYKRRPDPTCARFVPVKCDVFITEATFGLPVFRHPDTHDEIDKLLAASRANPDRCVLVSH